MAWVEAKTVFGGHGPPGAAGGVDGELATGPTEVGRRPLGASAPTRGAEGVVDFDDDVTAPYVGFEWEPTDVHRSSPR